MNTCGFPVSIMNTAPCNDPTLGRPLGVYTLYREMPRYKAQNGLEVMQKG